MFIANWKMNGSEHKVHKWIEEVTLTIPTQIQSRCVFCPPVCYLPMVSDLIKKRELKISLGAQDIDPDMEVSFTGGVSGSMLEELGCQYVIVGHSERRIHCKEDDKLLLQKLKAVLDNNMKVIFCIGETSEEKEAGKTSKVIKQQLEIIYQLKPNNLLIAYEPVWAIGSGQTASSTAIQEIHQLINKELRSLNINNFSGVVYGGSVNSSSAQEIFSLNAVDGLLIGGASLEGKEFSSIARSSCENFIE